MSKDITTPVEPTATEIEAKVETPVEKQEVPKQSEQERIDAIIEKRLAREREKFQKELEERDRLAKLSEEERKAELTKKYEAELSERETKLKFATNKLTYTKKFEEDGLPSEMVDYVIRDNDDDTAQAYEDFKAKWNDNMSKQLENKVKPQTDPTSFKVNTPQNNTLKNAY